MMAQRRAIEIPDENLPPAMVERRHAFDAAWEAVLKRNDLSRVRAKLSVHELRCILDAAVPAAINAAAACVARRAGDT